MRWINDEINARQPWKIGIAGELRGDDPGPISVFKCV